MPVFTRVWPRLGLPAVLPAQGVCCQKTRNIAAANGGSRERQFNDKLLVTARPAGTAARPSELVKLQRPLTRFSLFICSSSACSSLTPLNNRSRCLSSLLPPLLPRSGRAGDGPSRCCGLRSRNYVKTQQRGACCLMRTHSAMTTVSGTLPGGCVLPALGLGAAPLASAVACPARLRARPAQAHAACHARVR